MTSTLEHDTVDYLLGQADRVEVISTLATIENDLIYLPRARRDRSPHRLAPLLALASAVLLIIALSVVAGRGDPSTSASPAAAADTTFDSAVAPLPEPTAISPAPTVAPAPVHVPLPDGAVLNGIAPTCNATPDTAVFECTIVAFPEPLGTVDYTGYTSIIVDDSSHVSGGCRATNPDATAYLCYVGSRAIDEQVVGENYLGDWAPREYAAG